MPTNEQETVITFYRNDDACEICTSDRLMWTKLDKLVSKSDKWKQTEVSNLQNGEVAYKTYVTDKRLLTFRADFKKNVLTDEQRKTNADRMKKYWKSKEG